MVHTDPAVLKIQILQGQTAEFADTHSCSQQHHKFIVVFGVALVLSDEVHPYLLLPLGQGDALLRIVDHHIRQLEIKRVAPHNFLVIGHLKSRFYNAPDAGQGAVALSFLLQFDHPTLSIRHLDIPDLSCPEWFFLYDVHHKAVPDLRVIADTALERKIALQQFVYRNFATCIVETIFKASLQFILFFTQDFKIRRIDTLSVSQSICVAILIDQVFSLALSCPKNTSFIVFSS